ncbi:hypothetical protein TthTMY_23190 (plasmid) [Thermus thermophilus]|nr:hypothetical protein TthTMY_23190 [Thermus thermophilus]
MELPTVELKKRYQQQALQASALFLKGSVYSIIQKYADCLMRFIGCEGATFEPNCNIGHGLRKELFNLLGDLRKGLVNKLREPIFCQTEVLFAFRPVLVISILNKLSVPAPLSDPQRITWGAKGWKVGGGQDPAPHSVSHLPEATPSPIRPQKKTEFKGPRLL